MCLNPESLSHVRVPTGDGMRRVRSTVIERLYATENVQLFRRRPTKLRYSRPDPLPVVTKERHRLGVQRDTSHLVRLRVLTTPTPLCST